MVLEMANFPDEEKNGRDPDHWPDRAASATHKEAAAITALLSSEARGLALLRAVLDIGRNGLVSHRDSPSAIPQPGWEGCETCR